MFKQISLTLSVVLALSAACGDDGAMTDAGLPADAGPADGTGDAGVLDTGMPDVGPPDTGMPDVPIEMAPVFRNVVDTPDGELAVAALDILEALANASDADCPGCFEATRPNIRTLWDQTMAAWEDCFGDLSLLTPEAAETVIACLKTDDEYDRAKFGVFATAVQLDWFAFALRRASADTWEADLEVLLAAVAVPTEAEGQLSQADFDILAEWFLRGTPGLEDVLPHTDAPGECTSYIDPSVVLLSRESEVTGWSARNLEASLLMLGCADVADPLDCLEAFPSTSEEPFSEEWNHQAGAVSRILFEVPYDSSYWTKSSADGRFVGQGGGDGFGASIIDLQRSQVIGLNNASFDPGFFPDNSGFMFQGGGTRVCEQSVLTTGAPTSLDLTEEGCTRPRGVQLYQHVGAAVDGDDYWAVDSGWDPDPGGSDRDPTLENLTRRSSMTLHRFVNTGAGFVKSGEFDETIPYQRAAVLSPTMRFFVTQTGDSSGTPIGYVLHRLDLERDMTGAVTGGSTPEVGRYCHAGAKAAFSLDDRWLVTHHRTTSLDAEEFGYADPDDPEFAPLIGISNVYLIDMLSGERIRLTHMQPGQRALFPHFRSDGWLYYLARTGSLPEYIVATDAAIRLR